MPCLTFMALSSVVALLAVSIAISGVAAGVTLSPTAIDGLALWRGDVVQLTFTADGNSSFFASPTAKPIVATTPPAATNFNSFCKNAIQYSVTTDNVSYYATLPALACPDFDELIDTTVSFRFTACSTRASCTMFNATNVEFFTVALVIRAVQRSNPVPLVFSTTSIMHEAYVRQFGLAMNLSVPFDKFLAPTVLEPKPFYIVPYSDAADFVPASMVAMLDRANWLPSYASDSTSAVMTLPRQPAFDINGTVWINITNPQLKSKQAFLPKQLTIMIAHIDGRPLTQCVADNNILTEEELRASIARPVVRRIRLQDPKQDAFVADTPANMKLKLEGTQLQGSQHGTFQLTYTLVDQASFDVGISLAISPDAFDVRQQMFLAWQPRPDALASIEVGCGAITLTIVPSPGLVTGATLDQLGLSRSSFPVYPVSEVVLPPYFVEPHLDFTELDVNEAVGGLSIVVSLGFETWVNPATLLSPVKVYANVTRLKNDTDPVAEYLGYESLLANRTYLQYLNATHATIVILTTPEFNLPTGQKEFVQFYFDRFAVEGGVKPIMGNNTAILIRSVDPEMSISFAGGAESGAAISSEELWESGAKLQLTLRGDKWNPLTPDLWNAQHPSIVSAFGTGANGGNFTFAKFSDNRDTAVVLYRSVNISGRIATLLLRPIPGFSLLAEERVFVRQVPPLIAGRPSVGQQSFVIRVGLPSSIRVTFFGTITAPLSGDAVNLADGQVFETQFRKGWWFTLNATHENFGVLSQTEALAMARAMFDPNSPFGPFLSLLSFERSAAAPYVYNVSCPAIEDFDIMNSERLVITVPNDLYYSRHPLELQRASFLVQEQGHPVCTLRDVVPISEATIRGEDGGGKTAIFQVWVNGLTGQGSTLFRQDLFDEALLSNRKVFQSGPLTDGRIETRLLPPALVKFNHTNLRVRVVSWAQSQLVSTGNDLLFLEIVPDPTYDIQKSDVVTVTLSRHYFEMKEGCNSVNFTVQVLPGKGFTENLPIKLVPAFVQQNATVFDIVLLGELLTSCSFDLDIIVTVPELRRSTTTLAPSTTTVESPPGSPPSSTRNAPPTPAQLYEQLQAKLLNVTSYLGEPTRWRATAADVGVPAENRSCVRGFATSNFTRLRVTLPKVPGFKIFAPQNLTFNIPSVVVASLLQPGIDNNTLRVEPAPSRAKIVASKPTWPTPPFNSQRSTSSTPFATDPPELMLYQVLEPFDNATSSITTTPSPTSNTTTIPQSLTMSTIFLRVNESDIALGGVTLNVTLEDDYWHPELVEAAIIASFDRYSVSTHALNPAATSADALKLSLLFTNKSFSLPVSETLIIRLQPLPFYDAVDEEEWVIELPAAATVTGLAPTTYRIVLRVVPGSPSLEVVGTATVAGSRDFVLGGLLMYVYLTNDVFVATSLVASEFCSFAPCEVATLQSPRVLRVSFSPNLAALILENTTFYVTVPPKALRSRSNLTQIPMFIYVEAGIARIEFDKLFRSGTVTETTIRAGLLPTISIFLTGDTFVDDATVLSGALTSAVRCVPAPVDAFSFCSRAAFLFYSVDVHIVTPQHATVTLQADGDYDIYVSEKINITVGRAAVRSGFAPYTAGLGLEITPVVGSYTFTTSRSSVSAAEISRDPGFSVLVVLTLQSERWVPDPLRSVVDALTSSSSIALESNGFMRNRGDMFRVADVSTNGRSLSLQMLPSSGYSLFRAEDVTFFVSGSSVLSGIPPVATSASRSITVQPAGAFLQLVTPRIVAAQDVALYGLNLTIVAQGAEWDEFGTTPASLAAALSSSSTPADEPKGFAVFKSVLVPKSARVFNGLLSLEIRCNPEPKYALNRDEVVTITVPRLWFAGVAQNPPFPATFAITILSRLTTQQFVAGQVVLYLPEPVDERRLVTALASILGSSTDVVQIVQSEPFADGRYRKVAVSFSATPGVTDQRTPAESVKFLLGATDPAVLRTVANVSLALRADQPLSAAEAIERIGLDAQQKVDRNDTVGGLLWVWVSVALLVLLGIGGAVYYRYYVLGRISSVNRSEFRRSGDSGGGNDVGGGQQAQDVLKRRQALAMMKHSAWAADGFSDVQEEKRQRAEWAAQLLSDTVKGERADVRVKGYQAERGAGGISDDDDDDDFKAQRTNPILSAPRVRGTRVDLDDSYGVARQPKGVFQPAIEPVEFAAVSVQPLDPDLDTVAMFPAGSKRPAPFARRHRADSML